MKGDEDPDNIGLVLEWVYGTIVSTAEKARDGAKRLLGEIGVPAQQSCSSLICSGACFSIAMFMNLLRVTNE